MTYFQSEQCITNYSQGIFSKAWDFNHEIPWWGEGSIISVTGTDNFHWFSFDFVGHFKQWVET